MCRGSEKQSIAAQYVTHKYVCSYSTFRARTHGHRWPASKSNSNKYIVTMIDRATRCPEAVPVSKITAQTVAEVFVTTWISRFGCPATISTDQGRQFESDLFISLNKLLGIKKIRTTSYHPQANGMIERWHRTMKAAIIARGNSIQWSTELPIVLLGLRAAIRADDKVSPAQMLYGTNIRIPGVFFEQKNETALKKKNNETNNSSMKDNRGSHQNHNKVDESIKEGIKLFIESIPKIESHYIRANSKRHYIDGSKAVTDLHRDYVERCKSQNLPYGTYMMFYRIFTQDLNISFFTPKKNLCDVCEAYKNIADEEKESQKQDYEKHMSEKDLSRREKEQDKENKNIFVAVYDLKAVFQCPKGDVSVFYYKPKLNVLNSTIYDLKNNSVESYVWDESNANRGVNEIGTCVYKYLKKISAMAEDLDKLNVIFYSDNCCGQSKNKYITSLYCYAVTCFENIHTITHKYLIKGHTQNEGDNVHSLIEKEIKKNKKFGPIYAPYQYVTLIKNARKSGKPFIVNELTHDFFVYLKKLQENWGYNYNEDEQKNSVLWNNVKVLKFCEMEPFAFYYKTSYSQSEFTV
ncbi:hypothetical protein ABMA27_003465 [Loxostege sticticalis]|uniref:Integrase catalytic domain-containing protein n=1 Tax=Loxostege sticticalis TaxID=481309 RepID=A0ABR3HT81_LOXSC